jgi:hypothetical protein
VKIYDWMTEEQIEHYQEVNRYYEMGAEKWVEYQVEKQIREGSLSFCK